MVRDTVRWVEAGTGRCRTVEPAEVPALLARDDGFVWHDSPEPEDGFAKLLVETYGCHPRAADDVLQRNHIARMHDYGDQLYLAVHRPLSGDAGHVHYLELDLFVGRHHLVTTHGPRSPAVPLEEMLIETEDVVERLARGTLAPETPMGLAYALISEITNAEERIVNDFARQVGQLEQRVMTQAEEEDPQAFLDELFTTRHTLLTVRTMAAQSSEILARARHAAALPSSDQRLLKDLHDQYQRLDHVTHSQLVFLEGVTDFYRARNDTRMTIAGERLAVIAAITLPVTAISSVVGMNVIVNSETHWGLLAILLAIMVTMSLVLLRWAHKQGWW